MQHLTAFFLLIGSVALVARSAAANAPQPIETTLERRFTETVQPFLTNYCVDCHGTKKQEGKLDLSGYSSLATVIKHERVWEIILERLDAEEMPPEKAPRQPTAAERKAVIDWIRGARTFEAERHAGDPGPVLARRLSNAEFDYTIRDLTGVDLRPTREFPVDPANEAGFDNSGESLTISPALVKKQLAAARFVADHLVLKPHGIIFAPHPVVTETDRDKYCVQRIIDFYRRQRVDYADYFYAAWRFEQRAELDRPAATLTDFAAEAGISSKYLATVQSLLTGTDHELGPLATLRESWRALPADAQKSDEARRGCNAMRDLVLRLRKELGKDPGKLDLKGISNGSQSFVLWRNRKLADARMRYAGDATGDEAKSLAQFCRAFPDAFYVAERNPYFDSRVSGNERLLTAGFHLMQGYFRDDGPLCELILDEAGRREIDGLWDELNFVTLAPIRQYKDYIFFERAEPPQFIGGSEFDHFRSEDKDATSAAQMEQLARMYLERARTIGARDQVVEAIESYFRIISTEIRWIEKTRLSAEPTHLEALLEFTQRAYRRPLSPAERDELVAFYRELRDKDGLGHEEAIRDAIASVLLSPHVCFRFDLAVEGTAARPLSDYELASRLSYFLWSSMPDEGLLARAADGELHNPDILRAETRRMLRDPKIRGLAAEFGGNWLEFRRFEEHNSVDRERFPAFTNELRQAMYEEPLRFFVDVAVHDRSVLDFVYAGHTFVNPLLARHYGVNVADDAPNEWFRVDDAHRFGRGGLLPMSVFLTKNSPGMRTSPVKRGYWVVRRLLGEHIPAPPPDVPELPKDEAGLGELTLRQVLARHREHKSCSGCHERFDAVGLVFEGYGPIGERREKDLGDRPIDATAKFSDGSEGTGLDGLRRYFRERRQDEFLDNLCRKLLAYGLGRTLLLSDASTVQNMRARLVANDHRFGALVESIVTSPQFLNKRGRDEHHDQ